MDVVVDQTRLVEFSAPRRHSPSHQHVTGLPEALSLFLICHSCNLLNGEHLNSSGIIFLSPFNHLQI